MTRMALALLTTSIFFIAPSAAQDTASGRWVGEGAFNAGFTTGNTETTDIGLGLKADRIQGPWTVGLEASADFGETDGVETRNRWFVGTQLDRQINDRLYGFGRLSYEQDEFSGFDSRAFIGGGLGYIVLDGETTQWSIEGGPGYRIDEIADTVELIDGETVITEGETEESLAVRAASNFSHDFNDAVTFTNDTAVIWADVSTQVTNTAAVTAQLTDRISGRVSLDVRYDTNPPVGFEDTDTITKIGIVYAFGE